MNHMMMLVRALLLGYICLLSSGFKPDRNVFFFRRSKSRPQSGENYRHVTVVANSQAPTEKNGLRGQGRLNMPKLADKRALGEVKCRTCIDEGGPAFHLGLDTFRVPYALHEVNRAKVAEAMIEALSASEVEVEDVVGGVILLAGGEQQMRYDTDHETLFRQESCFQYLFGVSEAGVTGAVSLPSGAATLFVPRHGLEYEVFCGRYPSPADFKLKYGVEEVLYLDELADWLKAQGVAKPAGEDEHMDTAIKADQTNATEGTASAAVPPPPKVHLLWGQNSDSGNWAMSASLPSDNENPVHWRVDHDLLFRCLAEARVVKSDAEIDLMRYVNWVSSMAHVEVMKTAKPGMMEYQLESLFLHHTYTHGGCRHSAYSCICACGPSPAVLHYGHAGRPNDRCLAAGDLALLDMGAEYHCYASDVTCSFPISGTFTPDQRAVYEAVLAAQVAVYAAMAPGVLFSDLHVLAERTILEHLWAAGILKSGEGKDANEKEVADMDRASEANVLDAMQDSGLGAVFMPHGLGHLIGLDTHDVGGYLGGTPPRPTRPGVSRLRTARPLEAGMVVTVEPGCYFIDPLLDAALATPAQACFLCADRIARLRGTGGVRLEDDVRVRSEPPFVENLTLCPRTVAEVEAVLAGGAWPPAQDMAPELHRSWSKPAKGGAFMQLYDV